MFKTIPLMLSALLLSITAISTAHAALSAQTANTIEGTAPYLTYDGGTTKVTTTDELLGIKLTNGDFYKKSDLVGTNPGTLGNPIELPVAGQSFADIEMLVPPTVMSIGLGTLIVAPYNNWGDDDGDTVVSATGTLSLTLTDVDGKSVNRNDVLSACNAPYAVKLTSTAGTLKTQYGAPDNATFTGSDATYYIKPKIGAPYACWARPHLTNGTGTYASASHPEWEVGKGFKVPSPLGAAKTHFPRMGFHGAFFDMTVAGETGANVIAVNESSLGSGEVNATLGSTNIKLKLSVSPLGTNVVRVRLWGPSSGQRAGQPGPAAVNMPTEFNLYSDVAHTNKLYSFALSKWFVARPGVIASYAAAQTYCGGLSGSYRVPSVSEYTNANGDGWSSTLLGWTNNWYARAIGNGKQKTVVTPNIDDGTGGLFAEWGYINNGYYISSDFVQSFYWAVEPAGSTRQYYSDPYSGGLAYAPSSHSNYRAACVTP